MNARNKSTETVVTFQAAMAEWLRRVIRNHLEEIPREFESLCCRLFCADFWPSSAGQMREARRARRFEVLVAQWIAHQTSNLGVAGSNPVEHVFQ